MNLHPHMLVEIAVTWGVGFLVVLAIMGFSLWRLFVNDRKRQAVLRHADEVVPDWRHEDEVHYTEHPKEF